jgi:tripartite-type tricarboxylate transporter receptor subunit TctC
MRLSRRKLLRLTASAAAMPALSSLAKAQSWPVRPVRVLVGFPPGGAGDTVVRIMAQWLSDRLGQPFVVENRPGAGSNLAIGAALAAPPDGYTIAFMTTSSLINALLYESSGVNFLRDGAAAGGLVSYPNVIVAHPSFPAGTIAELIAHARSNPGKVLMASYGTGTTSHLAGELFKSMANVDMVHVPYRGDNQAVPDLLTGRVHLYFSTLITALPLIRSGAVRALGLLDRTRYHALPDVPTVGETVSGYEVQTISGFGVRKGTPLEIIERLNAEMIAGLASPAIKARYDELAVVPLPAGPAEFDATLAAQSEKWARVIRAANIRPD